MIYQSSFNDKRDISIYIFVFHVISMKKEMAQLKFKLAYSKKNWGAKYDRLEHFKRFSKLKKIVKELEGIGWLIVKKKANYTGISLNPKFKNEIVEFIEEQMPVIKDWIS